MTARMITINEVKDKIGRFSWQDAVDLIESSHGASSPVSAKKGHPLQHCEVFTRTWPVGPFENWAALVEEYEAKEGEILAAFKFPEQAAAKLNKKHHSACWSDQHLIQAVRDLFQGNGSFTALHHLQITGPGARLEYSRPTSHTTMVTVTHKKEVETAQPPTSLFVKRTRNYLAVLDLGPADHLHLHTLFPDPGDLESPDNPHKPDKPGIVSIKVRKPLNSVVFCSQFPI